VRVQFDEKADAVYFRLDESEIIESEEVRPGILLEFNKPNEVLHQANVVDLLPSHS
jgi:uncharacterized protein YuzE